MRTPRVKAGAGERPWVVNRALLIDGAEPVVPNGHAVRAVGGLDEAGRT